MRHDFSLRFVIASILAVVWPATGSSALAQAPALVHPDSRVEARVPVPRDHVSVLFAGVVLGPDGLPAEDAIVVSSAGGRAVAGPDGRHQVEADLPLGVETVELMAFAAGAVRNLVASVSVDVRSHSGMLPVGTLQLGQAPCQPRWVTTFQQSLTGRVSAMCVFDDGQEPALFAGGAFTTAGGETASPDGTVRPAGRPWALAPPAMSSP